MTDSGDEIAHNAFAVPTPLHDILQSNCRVTANIASILHRQFKIALEIVQNYSVYSCFRIPIKKLIDSSVKFPVNITVRGRPSSAQIAKISQSDKKDEKMPIECSIIFQAILSL